MPHGYGGYTGNGLLTSMTFLIFTLIRTKQKGISKKDMEDSQQSILQILFVMVLWNLSPLKQKKTKMN